MRRTGRREFTLLAVASLAALLVGGGPAASAVDNGVTATFDPETPNGEHDFYTSPVTISFSGADGDTCEGLATPPGGEVGNPGNSITYNGPARYAVELTGTCTPADPSGSPYAGTFTPFKYDAQAPTWDAQNADIIKPAGTANSTAVTYQEPTATDNLDGSPSVSCNPASGETLPAGAHKVMCTAKDAAGNATNQQYTITADGAPTVTVPDGIPKEAESPAGAVFSFSATAFDAEDGPIAVVQCTPSSGSTFGFGETTVTCTAEDSEHNVGSASFTVTVQDTKGPRFTVPPNPITVQAKSLETGTPAAHRCIQRFLAAPKAFDDGDGETRPVTNNAPPQFPIGDTVVTFTAVDSRDHTTSRSAVVAIAAGPQECTVDARPPRNVRNVRVREENKLVVLRWRNPGAADLSHIEIRRSRTDGQGRTLTFRTKREFLRDDEVRNGIEYRYVIWSVDEAGNKPNGVERRATPRRILLLRPRDQAVISRPPLLDWVKKARARYYNLQLHRMVNGELRKVLSRWPAASSFKLAWTWRFDGRRYRFVPGRYFWYVWPGFGPRPDANYGELMGANSFRVKRR